MYTPHSQEWLCYCNYGSGALALKRPASLSAKIAAPAKRASLLAARCAGKAAARQVSTRPMPNPETTADILRAVESRGDLSRAQAEAFMEELLSGRIAQPEIVRFLLAMRAKGETVEELVGFARTMRRHATPVPIPSDGVAVSEWALVDTCGTGGDGSGTFNVSTAAALVAAGAGVRVAKHGNRSISTRCGSADVLEALGVKLDLPAERAGQAIAQIGFGFLFAPAMHTAMKHAMPARREVGGRTVFNLLGPLTNPAGAAAQVVGVPAVALVEKLGHALAALGAKRAFVVHGLDGIDEISLSDETEVADVQAGAVRRYRVKPEDFGVTRSPREALLGGDAATNAQIIRRILESELGPRRDFVVINAAAALVAAGRARDFIDGARIATQSIDSGAARAKLEALVAFSRS
jgi:anthranilate phosphoribosyltransferase